MLQATFGLNINLSESFATRVAGSIGLVLTVRDVGPSFVTLHAIIPVLNLITAIQYGFTSASNHMLKRLKTKRHCQAGSASPRDLDLPMDTVQNIFNKLQLPAMIMFSQICRSLCYQFRFQCYSAIRRASASERLESLALLGGLLPDHRLCTHCRALHPLDPHGLPVTRYGEY